MRPVLILLLLIPQALAATQHIDIHIQENDLVHERIVTSFSGNESYSSIEFSSAYPPVAIISDDTVELSEGEESTVILTGQFDADHPATLTLIIDGLVQSSGGDHVFSMHFTPQTDAIRITVTLPEGAVLADREPSVSPRPDSVRTDGRQLTLEWLGEYEELDIIILYEGKSNYWLISIILAVLASLGAIGWYIFHRSRSKQRLRQTLTADEQLVLDVVRSGTTKQKDVQKEVGFSKPKMSKVLRRMEEKEVLTREPHFRTNIIKIKKGWR